MTGFLKRLLWLVSFIPGMCLMAVIWLIFGSDAADRVESYLFDGPE